MISPYPNALFIHTMYSSYPFNNSTIYIRSGMDKLSLLRKNSIHWSQSWWMKTRMIGMSTILFSYKITFKVGIGHIPF